MILVSGHTTPWSIFLSVRLIPNFSSFHLSCSRTLTLESHQNSYRNPDFWGYCLGPYPAFSELVCGTYIASFSPTLLMPQLGFNAHSSWYGWCIFLFNRIMTLICLNPQVARWAPLESRYLVGLHVGVTTYYFHSMIVTLNTYAETNSKRLNIFKEIRESPDDSTFTRT